MAVARKHLQTSGAPINPPTLSQETTLGSRHRTETRIHTLQVEVTLVLETPIQEDIPDKTQAGTLQLVEVTLINPQEGITQTRTLQEVIQVQAATPTNLQEAVIPIRTLPVATPQEAIQLPGDIPTSLGKVAIQTSIQVVIQLVDIQLLGATLIQDGEVAIQSEEEALGRAGVHQALTLEVILVVELEDIQIGIPTIRSSALATV